MPAPLGPFELNPLLPPSDGGLDQQAARSHFGDGAQRESEFGGQFSGLVVGELKRTRDLVMAECGLESHHVQLVRVLDEGGFLVISPSCRADSAHVFPNDSLNGPLLSFPKCRLRCTFLTFPKCQVPRLYGFRNVGLPTVMTQSRRVLIDD